LFRKKKQKKPDRYGSWHKIHRNTSDETYGADNSENGSSFSESEDITSEHSLLEGNQKQQVQENAEAASHARTFEEDESLEQLDAIISNLKQKSHQAESERDSSSFSSVQTKPGPGHTEEIEELIIALMLKLEQCDEREFSLVITSETVQKLKRMLTDRKFPPSESAER